MCRIKAKIENGYASIEKIAYIKTDKSDSTEVFLTTQNVGKNHVIAAEVGRKDDKVLVELPRETSSGKWRVWVNKSQIL